MARGSRATRHRGGSSSWGPRTRLSSSLGNRRGVPLWDLSHLHEFELADGRLIGYPDDEFAPDVVWLDHAKLKVCREVKPGEEFSYVFDLGDNWQHRCVAEPVKADPPVEYGVIPGGPIVIWGWGLIPDQYGRRSFDSDEDG